MELFFVVLLKPFIALLILVPVRMASEALRLRMPESRLKCILFSPLSSESSRRA